MSYRISYGIHRGTLLSRDSASGGEFDTKEEALQKAEEIAGMYQKGNDPFGYMLWYCSVYDSNNKKICQYNGYPYS